MHGENFGCCKHTENEIIQNNGAFPDDCSGAGPPCTPENTPRLVLTDENGLVKKMKVKSFGHYTIEAELPDGTGISVMSVEVGPKAIANSVFKSQARLTYQEGSKIGFTYSKPQLTETKFGLEISGADITNSFDATGSTKYGTLVGEEEKQWQLYLFGDNFGASQSRTVIEVLAGFFNDGTEDWKNCTSPIWHSPTFDSAGFPYLSCFPPAVTVGNKKWRITIGSNSQVIDYTIYGRPIMGKCPPDFYGLTDEYCVKCWNYVKESAPDSPIMLANCSGIYDANIQVWKKGKQVTVGGTVEPVARFGYSIWPPKECSSGQCDKRNYKGLMPQESGISLVPDAYEPRGGDGKTATSCLPTWDQEAEIWNLPSMICDSATKPGDSCHPLRAYGKYSSNPDSKFEHTDRNLHQWPPHKLGGKPPMNQPDCVSSGGTWAPHVIFDRSSRTEGAARKRLLPDACAFSPYEGGFTTASGPDDKKECRKKGGSWANIDSDPEGCGTDCAFECRMPCCLSIFEDGPPKYTERSVDEFPDGGNTIADPANYPLYEFLGKRPVCSRANPCEPKFACLGGDMCLEGYVKYYEPYVERDGEFRCQNFHYKLPGKCPSPIVTWGPIIGYSEFDADFQDTEIPNFHAFLISSAFETIDGNDELTASNTTFGGASAEGSFKFQTINPKSDNYRAKFCDEEENDQHCFWGTPVKVLKFADETPIDKTQWVAVSKKKIKKMNFGNSATQDALLGSSRVLKQLTPGTPNIEVKVQMYDQQYKVVPAKVLMLITYPSLRLSGVPESIDPDGGNAGWCLEHPARCYFERNPHPKGDTDAQGNDRPQANICCFAPKCTECDPATHFRMEENCIACPKCWWCIPLAAFCICVFGSIAMHFLMKMRLNFVIISLALDHMQILGLLAGAKINWPWQISIILKWFVFFQLDIDVAGPECLARGLVTFENKWWFKVLVPFIGMFVILIYKTVSTLIALCCQHGKKVKKRMKNKNKIEETATKLKIKSGLSEDLAHNTRTTKTVTFMVKAFINIVAFCCKSHFVVHCIVLFSHYFED